MFKYVVSVFIVISAWSILTYADQSADGQPQAVCGDVGDCPTIETNCKEKCGCDKTIPTFYDNKTSECVINIKLLILSLIEKYDSQDYETSLEDDMASKIEAEADRIFKGIIVAAILVITCSSICVFTACIYCCRINYADYQLKKSIKQLAKKYGTKPQLKAPPVKPITKPVSESCNVIVEEAGVFCV